MRANLLEASESKFFPFNEEVLVEKYRNDSRFFEIEGLCMKEFFGYDVQDEMPSNVQDAVIEWMTVNNAENPKQLRKLVSIALEKEAVSDKKRTSEDIVKEICQSFGGLSKKYHKVA